MNPKLLVLIQLKLSKNVTKAPPKPKAKDVSEKASEVMCLLREISHELKTYGISDYNSQLEELKKLKKFIFENIPYAVVPLEMNVEADSHTIDSPNSPSADSVTSVPNIAPPVPPVKISQSQSLSGTSTAHGNSSSELHKTMVLKNIKKRPLFMKGAQNQQGFKKRKVANSAVGSLTVGEKCFFSSDDILVPNSIMIKFFSRLKLKFSIKGFENPNSDFEKFLKFSRHEPFIQMVALSPQDHLYAVLASDGTVIHAYCPYPFDVPKDIELVPLGSTVYNHYVSLTIACAALVRWKRNENFSIHFHPSASCANANESALYCMAICSDLAHSINASERSYDFSQLKLSLLKYLNKNSEMKFSSKKLIPKLPDEIRTVKLHCLCSKPFLPNLDGDMVECVKCKKWYHRDCVGCSPQEAEGYWICPLCTELQPENHGNVILYPINYENFCCKLPEWSQSKDGITLRNSCPIDNFFSILTHANFHLNNNGLTAKVGEFVANVSSKQFKPITDFKGQKFDFSALKHLYEIMQHCARGELFEARLKWAVDVLGFAITGPINLWGSLWERFTQYFNFPTVCFVSCTDRRCKNQSKPYILHKLHCSLKNFKNLADAMTEFDTNANSKNHACDYKVDAAVSPKSGTISLISKCPGSLVYTARSPYWRNVEPPFLLIQLSDVFVEEIDQKICDKIVLFGHEYTFAGLVLSEPGHFCGILNCPTTGRKYIYDGMDVHRREVRPEDPGPPRKSVLRTEVSVAIYVSV